MAEKDDDHSSDGAAGYGRPPKKYRIALGETRNPWGRKGKPGLKSDFMDEKIEIRLDGKCFKVTRAEALDHGLFKEAIKGNVSAAKELERRRNQRASTASDGKMSALLLDEQSALDRYVERRLAEAKSLPKTTSAVDTVASLREAAPDIAPGCKK